MPTANGNKNRRSFLAVLAAAATIPLLPKVTPTAQPEVLGALGPRFELFDSFGKLIRTLPAIIVKIGPNEVQTLDARLEALGAIQIIRIELNFGGMRISPYKSTTPIVMKAGDSLILTGFTMN